MFTLGVITLGCGGRHLAQQVQTFHAGVQLARLPGLEQARERHAGFGSFWTPRPAADFADDDQWTQAALGQIVVRAQPESSTNWNNSSA